MKKHLLTNSKSGRSITKLNSNAFTLIELLAIIVILAIIAVITVPIILNIIENSRKGAATDSAYGYKDSVNKTYVTELQNHNKIKLDGAYTVNSDGSLTPADGNTFKFGDSEYGNSLNVAVSGTIPSSGELTYANNVLKSGYLVIGDYRVTFNSDGTVTTTKNTSSSSNISNNNSNNNGGEDETPVAKIPYTDNDSSGTLSVGDYIEFVDDNGTSDNENDDIVNGFYVINPSTSDGTVTLLSKYNISNTGNEMAVWRQTSGLSCNDESCDYDSVSFCSGESYWWDDPDEYTVLAKYSPLYSGEENLYIYDLNSDLYSPMENYKNYLKVLINDTDNNNPIISRIRPMSYGEASSVISNDWSHNQWYSLGSLNIDSGWVWYVKPDGTILYSDYPAGEGVRPVVEISTSQF